MKYSEKVPIANEMLIWLKEKDFNDINAIYSVYRMVITPFADSKGYEYYEVWKVWELLKKENRVEGKFGRCYIVNYSPIVVTSPAIASIEELK